MESTQILTQVIDLPEAETEEIPGVAPQLVEVARLTIDGVDHVVWNRINTIGRASDCDIIIENEAVSSRHAIIEANTYGLHKIIDLGSTNKTRINGVIIPPKIPKTIESGATLRIANVDAVYNCITRDEIPALNIKTSPQRSSAGVVQIPGTPDDGNTSNLGNIPETPDSKSEGEGKSDDDIFGINSAMFSSLAFGSNAAVQLADDQSKMQEPSNASILEDSVMETPHSSPDHSQDIVAGSQPVFCSARENERLIVQSAETQLAAQAVAEDWDLMEAETQLRNPPPSINTKASLPHIGDLSFSEMLTQVRNEKVADPVAKNNYSVNFDDMLTQPRNPAPPQPAGQTTSNDLDILDVATQIRNPALSIETNRGAFRETGSPDNLSDFIGEEVGGIVASSDGEDNFSQLATQPRNPTSNFVQPTRRSPTDDMNLSIIETQPNMREVHVNHSKESRNIEDQIGAMNERNIYSAASQQLMRSAIKRTTTSELLEMLENSETPGAQDCKPIGRQNLQDGLDRIGDSDLMRPPSSRNTKPSITPNEVPQLTLAVFEDKLSLSDLKRETDDQSSDMSAIGPKILAVTNGEADSGDSAIEAPVKSEQPFSQMLTQVRPIANQTVNNPQIAGTIDITDMETQEFVTSDQRPSGSNFVKDELLIDDSNVYLAETVDVTPGFKKEAPQFLTPKVEKVQARESPMSLDTRLAQFQSENPVPERRPSPGEKSTLSNNFTAKLPQTPSSDFELNIDESMSDMLTQVCNSNNAQLQSPKVVDVIDIADMETQLIVPQKPSPGCEKVGGKIETNRYDIYLADTEEVTPATIVEESTSEAKVDDTNSPMVEASQFPIARVTKPIVYSDEDSPLVSCDDFVLPKDQRTHKKSDTSSTDNCTGTGVTRDLVIEENTTTGVSVNLDSPDGKSKIGAQKKIEETAELKESASPSLPNQMKVRSNSPSPQNPSDLICEEQAVTSTSHSNPGASTCNLGSVQDMDTIFIANMETQNAVERVDAAQTERMNNGNAHSDTISCDRSPEVKKPTEVLNEGASDDVISSVPDGNGEKLMTQKVEDSTDSPPIEYSQFPVQRVTKRIVYSDEDSPPAEPVNLNKKKFSPKKQPKAKSKTPPSNVANKPKNSSNELHLDEDPPKIIGLPKLRRQNTSPVKCINLKKSDQPLQPCDTEKGPSRSKPSSSAPSHPDVGPPISGSPKLPSDALSLKKCTPPKNESANPPISGRTEPKLKSASIPELQTVLPAEREKPGKQIFKSSNRRKGQIEENSQPMTGPVKLQSKSISPKKRSSTEKSSATPFDSVADPKMPEPSTTSLAELQPSSQERRERPRKQAIMSCDAENAEKSISRFELQSDEDSPPLTGRKQRRKGQSPKKRPSAESSCCAEVTTSDPGPSTGSPVDLQAERRERPRKQAVMSCDAENVRKATLFDHDNKPDPKTEQPQQEVVTPPVNVKKFKRAPSMKKPNDLMDAFENESPILNTASPVERQKKTAPVKQVAPKLNPPADPQPTWTSPLSRRGKKLSVQDASVPECASAPSPPKATPSTPATRRKAKVNNTAETPEEPTPPQRVPAQGRMAKAPLLSTSLSQEATNARLAMEASEINIPNSSSFKRPAKKRGSPQLETSTSDVEKSLSQDSGSRRSTRQRKKKKSFDDLFLQKEQEIKEKKISSQLLNTPAPSSSAEKSSEPPNADVPLAIASSTRRRGRPAAAKSTALTIASTEFPPKRTRNSQTLTSSQDTSDMDSQSQTLPDAPRIPRQRRKKLSFDELVSQKEEEIKQRKNANKARRVCSIPVASTSGLQPMDSSVASVERNDQNHSTARQTSSSCEPPTKRARNSQATPSTSLARNPSMIDEPPRVMFTSHINDSKLRTIVKKFGGKVVSQPKNCSVLITDKVRRTANFLSVLAQGKPIVSPNWLSKSKAFNGFTDPEESLLTDPESEQTFDFSLVDSLGKSRDRRLLKDYTIYVTPSVLPPLKEMQQIVECSGGRFEKTLPSTWPANAIVISHQKDASSWRQFTKKGVCPPILSAEAILSGVLRQEFNPLENRLR